MENKNNKSERIFPATVANIINNYKIVINRGSDHEITLGQRFLIYDLSTEEIIDPVSKKPLGYLELVKGTGVVIHVMEKMAIVESDNKKTITRTKPAPLPFMRSEEITEEEDLPFDDPEIGDKAKPI
ncbi:hypothetical protein ES708_04547 [subsurface metagenome]